MVLGKASRNRADEFCARVRDAARDIVAEVGVDQLSVPAVAERVGVSVTTLYRHYQGGQSLLHVLKTDRYPGRFEGAESLGDHLRSRPDHQRGARTVGRIQAAAREAIKDSEPDQVTVAEIAGRAVIHPRTFYRYFVDVSAVMNSIGVGDPTSRKGLINSFEELRHVPKRSTSARTLERLQAAARQLVEEVGVDRLTTADVAERAGVSIGTFYRYFNDRIALLDALQPDRHDAEKLRQELKMVRAQAELAWEAGFRVGWASAERCGGGQLEQALRSALSDKSSQ